MKQNLVFIFLSALCGEQKRKAGLTAEIAESAEV